MGHDRDPVVADKQLRVADAAVGASLDLLVVDRARRIGYVGTPTAQCGEAVTRAGSFHGEAKVGVKGTERLGDRLRDGQHGRGSSDKDLTADAGSGRGLARRRGYIR